MTTDNILPLDRWKDYTRKIPYGMVKIGFMVDPEDPYHLIPNTEHIYWLEKAFDYIDAGSSFREVCEWLGQKLKRTMVHQTLAAAYKGYRKPHLRTKTHKRKGVVHSRETKKVISAKLSATAAAKRAKKISEEHEIKKKQLKLEDYDEPPKPVEKKQKPFIIRDENDKAPRVLFRANPGPQSEFLSSSEPEVLYGGSAGGGPESWFFRLLLQ